MKKFTFYFQELVGGNNYKEVIEAGNFREARNLFFDKHQRTPHKIIAVWNHETNERLY